MKGKRRGSPPQIPLSSGDSPQQEVERERDAIIERYKAIFGST
jgi:hypothetical protein